MRTVAIVTQIVLFIGCGRQPLQQPTINTATSLTLKMQEAQTDGEPSMVMLLCEAEKCTNPLRDKSGKNFHFKNYADLYNEKVQGENKGQKIKMALLGITMTATAAGALLYIKSDAMRRTIGWASEKIKRLTDDIADLEQGIEKNKHKLAKLRAEKTKHVARKKKLATRDAFVTPAYWTALGLSALGTNALAFAPGIAEDTLWKNNKRMLADLFIHGNAVKVTKDELTDLFAILVKQVPVTVDVAVQSYLFSI